MVIEEILEMLLHTCHAMSQLHCICNRIYRSFLDITGPGPDRTGKVILVELRTIFRNDGDRLLAGVINRQPTLEDVRQILSHSQFLLRKSLLRSVKVCGFRFIFVACRALRNLIWFFV